MMGANYYTAREVARDFCHVTPDAFYRSRETRHTRDGLPRPYQMNPMLFDRMGMDAWRSKNDPRRPGPPANDSAPWPEPASDEEKLARLHDYYRKAAPAG